MKAASFSDSAERIAKSSRPWAVVCMYETDTHEQGNVLSTHSTWELAQVARLRTGLITFLAVKDARDYA